MAQRGRSSLRLVLLVAAALAIALLGLFLEHRPELDRARSELRSRRVPIRALGSQRTGKVLGWMERIQPRFSVAGASRGSGRGRSRRFYFSLDPASPETMASSTAADPALVASGIPIVSVALAAPDHGAMLATRFKRGRGSERPGYVSYFDDGRLLFARGVGVRLHGGMSRLYSPVKSLRLYFREELGEPQFPPGLLFDEGSEPLRRVIVHNDVQVSLQRNVRSSRRG